MTDERRTELIQSVDKLLWKLSHRSWERLPLHAKGAVDPEDLHQEALLYLWREAPNWDPAKSSFVTFAHIVANSQLMNIATKFRAKMRTPPCPIYSMTGLEGETRDIADPRIES